jgi:large subunit ribosomal protein L29
MKATKEFQNLNVEEIKNRLNELRKELMKENVQVSSGTAPSNPGKLKQTKKNIARLLTILKQKEVKIK